MGTATRIIAGASALCAIGVIALITVAGTTTESRSEFVAHRALAVADTTTEDNVEFLAHRAPTQEEALFQKYEEAAGGLAAIVDVLDVDEDWNATNATSEDLLPWEDWGDARIVASNRNEQHNSITPLPATQVRECAAAQAHTEMADHNQRRFD